MKKLLGIVVLGLFFYEPIFAEERSEIEIKNGIFLKDVEAFGTFNKIDTAPLGMFKPRDDQFVQMSKYSQGKIGLIFVQQKEMLDKYPENLMKAMGHFEFFYMEQLRKKQKNISRFKEKWPNIPNSVKKDIKSLYSLNQARKTMRESMGLTLNDDVQDALQRYMLMHDLLSQAKKV